MLQRQVALKTLDQDQPPPTSRWLNGDIALLIAFCPTPTPNPLPPLLLYAILRFWLDHCCIFVPQKGWLLGKSLATSWREKGLCSKVFNLRNTQTDNFWKLSINLQWLILGMGPGRSPPPPPYLNVWISQLAMSPTVPIKRKPPICIKFGSEA